MVGTRKLAALLAADVAGYSRLTGEDEEGTLARIRALRSEVVDPVLAANRGRVANTAGDSLLVEFASAVDAVRAAIEFQRSMALRNAYFKTDRRIEFRIGIHVGDVMVEHDGDLRGDGVNIAARLEGVAKPGGICLSEDAYRQVKGRINAGFVDLGEQRLKNIAGAVRAYALQSGAPASAKPAAQEKPRSKVAPLGLALAALLIAVAGAAWYLFVANRPAGVATNTPAPVASTVTAAAEPAHLSIVVLPFTNLSGDPAQDYFADGITENLTTDLSRIHNSFVIARNTAFTFKGKNVDAKEIGKELGVRYVLEGSVQREGTRVRVNAQLIDAETGAHFWADRFDEDVVDLFKLQDQVVARLGDALGFELVKAEAEKSAASKNPDAIDLAMRGWATMWQSYPLPAKDKRDSHYAALALFDQALRIDPNDADALAGDAFTYMSLFIFGEGNPETDLDAKIIGQADRAIALAPDNMRAYAAKSFYLTVTGRAKEGFRAAVSGLAINANYVPLLDARVLAETALGGFEQAKSDAQQAMRLGPRGTELASRLVALGLAELGLRQFEAAIAEFQKSIDAGNRSFIPYVNLAAAYALAGKIDEARTALAEARRLNPDLTVKWLSKHAPDVPPLFEGLREAGLPEE